MGILLFQGNGQGRMEDERTIRSKEKFCESHIIVDIDLAKRWLPVKSKATVDSRLRPGFYITRCRPPTNSSDLHVVPANALGAQLLTLYKTTKSNSVAQPGEYVGNLWLLAPAWRSRRYCQCHTPYSPLWKFMTSSTKPEVHNVFHGRQRRTELYGRG